MSTEAAVAPRPVTIGRRRIDVGARIVEAWFKAHAVLVYVFLYLPILIVVILSFNATNRNVTDWQGFSLKWYERALESDQVQRALWNSATIAFINAGRARAISACHHTSPPAP